MTVSGSGSSVIPVAASGFGSIKKPTVPAPPTERVP
jgi:hypothetical protein